MALAKGVPGGYEEFNYFEAKQVVANIQRQESYIMQKLKIGLAKRVLNANTINLEKQLEN